MGCEIWVFYGCDDDDEDDDDGDGDGDAVGFGTM
jgi:hypothetical protein